jgi:hypothetical protein
MRQDGWDMRLRACLEASARTPFAWGRFDCCRFMGMAVQAQTGCDPMAQWPRYRSARGAAASIRKAGHADMAEAIAALMARCGFAEIAPAYAQRGDVVLLPYELAGWSVVVGIVDLDAARVLSTGPDGLVRRPVGAVLRAWSLG